MDFPLLRTVHAICSAHRRFIAGPVGLLRSNFFLGKGLADPGAQSPLLIRPTRFRLILAFCQYKFGVGSFQVTEVGASPSLGHSHNGFLGFESSSD